MKKRLLFSAPLVIAGALIFSGCSPDPINDLALPETEVYNRELSSDIMANPEGLIPYTWADAGVNVTFLYPQIWQSSTDIPSFLPGSEEPSLSVVGANGESLIATVIPSTEDLNEENMATVLKMDEGWTITETKSVENRDSLAIEVKAKSAAFDRIVRLVKSPHNDGYVALSLTVSPDSDLKADETPVILDSLDVVSE